MPGRTGRRRPYQLVDDMVTVGSKELTEHFGLPDTQAREVMRQIAHKVCFLNKKCVIYVPEDLDFELSKRDEEIWADYQTDGPNGVRKFDPRRVDQLAQQHDLTTQQIYNIIRLMKRREVAERQGVLPGLELA